MKRIKILRIIARLNIGGPAIHAILLTAGLNKEKFESVLITGNVSASEGDMAYLAQNKGITPVLINGLGREISLKDDLIVFWKILRKIVSENPDIVHTHTAKAGTLGRLAVIFYNGFVLVKNGIFKIQGLFRVKSDQKVRKMVKLVHTFHGHIFHSYFGQIKTKIFILTEKVLAIFTDRIITISQKQTDDVCNSYRISPAYKTSTIPLGLDLSKYLNTNVNGDQFRDEYGISKESLLIGIVGRLTPVKNHKMFLDSIKIIKSRPFNISSRFAIIGDGELRKDLVNYAIKLGIKEEIIFAGWRKDIDIIYAAMDLVALTSFNEGTPVSLIEAMAAGKAVAATRVGGVIDLMGKFHEKLDNNNNVDIFDNGILVKSGDIQGFAEALEFLINNNNMRYEMGMRGRAFVKDNFGIDRLVKDIEDLYESLLV